MFLNAMRVVLSHILEYLLLHLFFLWQVDQFSFGYLYLLAFQHQAQLQEQCSLHQLVLLLQALCEKHRHHRHTLNSIDKQKLSQLLPIPIQLQPALISCSMHCYQFEELRILF